jgi:hypothetical protein
MPFYPSSLIMTPRRWIHRFTKKNRCPTFQTVQGFFLCFVGLKMNEARVVIESEARLTNLIR